MRLRTLLLLLFSLFAMSMAPRAAHAAETPTEAAALSAAENDHTAYTLPPDKLAKAETLERIRNLVTFGGTAWSIVVLILLLQLRVAARMRNVAVNLSKNRWVQCFVFFLEFLHRDHAAWTCRSSLYSHHVSVRVRA